MEMRQIHTLKLQNSGTDIGTISVQKT